MLVSLDDRHVVEQTGDDIAIPGRDFTFGELERAQADGDLAALKDAGMRSGRVVLADLLAVREQVPATN